MFDRRIKEVTPGSKPRTWFGNDPVMGRMGRKGRAGKNCRRKKALLGTVGIGVPDHGPALNKRRLMQ
jgi:hypothetical protein